MDRSGASGGSDTEKNYNEPVATTTTAENGCNASYFKTLPGILKVAETALSIAALVCGLVSLGPQGGWGTFVAGCSLAGCIVLLLLHATGLIARIPYNIPLSEFISAVLFAVFFLIAGLVCAIYGAWPPYGAYAFFGFVACGTYVVDAVVQFRIIRGGVGFTWSSRPPQSAPTRQEPERY